MAAETQHTAQGRLSRRQFLRRAAEGPVPDQAPRTVTLSTNCLAYAGVACRVCDDACAPSAIRFRPQIGGHYYPVIENDKCDGCLSCVAVCPAGALQSNRGRSDA